MHPTRFLIVPVLLALAACSPGSPAAGGASVPPSSGASGAPVTSPGASPAAGAATGVTFTIDGVPAKNNVLSATRFKPTGFDIVFGQPSPGERSLLLQLAVDPEKSKSGTWGIEAVGSVQGLVSPGAYSTFWQPDGKSPITFTIQVADGKLTMRWAGKMRQETAPGVGPTIDVVAECKDAPYVKKF